MNYTRKLFTRGNPSERRSARQGAWRLEIDFIYLLFLLMLPQIKLFTIHQRFVAISNLFKLICCDLNKLEKSFDMGFIEII